MRTGRRELIRDLNRTLVLNLVREGRSISRADIARITGLGPSTVTSITASLLADELLVEPAAGTVWVRASQTSDGRRVLHLIDLRGQEDDRWDRPKRFPEVVSALRLEWPGISEPLAASPWVSEGDPIPMRPRDGGWVLPRFRRWSMVVEATTP